MKDQSPKLHILVKEQKLCNYKIVGSFLIHLYKKDAYTQMYDNQ